MSFSDAAARLKKAREETQPDQAATQISARPPDKPVDFKELYLLRARILGVLIRDARLARGHAIEDCAAALGIRPETMAAWEYGDESPSLPQLEILAHHLGVPVSQFWASATMIHDSRTGPLPQDEYLELRHRVIGALLRKARTEAGISLEELAGRSGVPADRIAAYELGQNIVPLTELTSLASAVNVSLRYFLEESSRVGRWLELQEEFKKFSEMPDELRAFVSNPTNGGFIELAMWFSRLEVNELRGIAESILNFSRMNMNELRGIAEDILNITL